MIPEDSDRISYLANILAAAYADGKVTPKEELASEEVRKRIKALKGQFNQAKKLVESGEYSPTKVGSFSTQVMNLADMLYVCLVDGELAADEIRIVQDFCQQTLITQEILDVMVAEADVVSSGVANQAVCGSCKKIFEGDVKFCPHCGAAVSDAPPQSTKVSLDVPPSGYSIEFCESAAAAFSSALEAAKNAPIFDQCERNKKNWYLASWPGDQFSGAIDLVQKLSGLRNRKLYINGEEADWNDVFGFVWCFNERNSAYKPTDYCFGADENRINPWGCKQIQMDWTDWADWFSYGSFSRKGLGGKTVWTFDKQRITHELNANFHKYRYCPFVRAQLLQAVLDAIPEHVEIEKTRDWEYHKLYEEAPGAIKVSVTMKEDGYSYTDDFFSDGIRPRGFRVLNQILKEAFAKAGVTDITVNQIMK